MADNDNSLVSEEEFERAMEALSKSKNKRVKEINQKKKEKKVREDKAEGKVSFAERCKKDPVIPVCLALAVIAVLAAALYFILPTFFIPSLDMDLQELKNKYFTTAVYNAELTDKIPALPEFETVDANVYAPDVRYDGHASSFRGSVVNNDSDMSLTLSGMTRDCDGKITVLSLRGTCTSNTALAGKLPSFYVYAASFIQVFEPSMDEASIMTFINDVISAKDYVCKGDYCYRIYYNTDGTFHHLIMDIVNKDNIVKGDGHPDSL